MEIMYRLVGQEHLGHLLEMDLMAEDAEKDNQEINKIAAEELSQIDTALKRKAELGKKLGVKIDKAQADSFKSESAIFGLFLEIFDCFDGKMKKAIDLERQINTEYEELLSKKRMLIALNQN